MKPHLLLVEPMMPDIEKALDEAYEVHRHDGSTVVDQRIQAVVTGGATGLPRAIMDALPLLEIISINGIGTDAVDLVEAGRRNIAVTTTPGVLTADVADLAMAFILAAMRDLLAGDRFVREGQWGRGTLPLAHRVTGRKLGIFGMGQVGQAIAKRAIGFDMPVSYYSRRDMGLPHVTYVPTLLQLAQKCDVLVIAASGGVQSRHLVNREILEAIGPDGLLVNVARGSIVDEAALVTALQTGRLGRAALDVFEREPTVPQGLSGMATVVLQPHRASATVETRQQMGRLVLDNLEAHFAGKPLVTPVR